MEREGGERERERKREGERGEMEGGVSLRRKGCLADLYFSFLWLWLVARQQRSDMPTWDLGIRSPGGHIQSEFNAGRLTHGDTHTQEHTRKTTVILPKSSHFPLIKA